MKLSDRPRGRVLRLLAAVAVTVPIAMALTPASATAADCGYSSGSQSQQCHGQAQSTPKVGTGQDVRAVCAAETPFNVQATIVSCEIIGTNNDTHWSGASVLNGPAAALTHTWPASELSSNSYQLCVYAGYISTTGVYHQQANPACGVTIGSVSIVV
jgi:hypothetical protein